MVAQFDKILGALYGQAIGDAMGMPPELWSRAKLQREYPLGITDFLDGNPANEISYNYEKGQFTDDTAQALIILDSLIENDYRIVPKDIAQRLTAWAEKEDAFARNLLGQTSRFVLRCYIDGTDPTPYTEKALTNGAAMRVSPVGALFGRHQKKELCDFVAGVSRVTHASDITIASACMPAMAIASLIDGSSREQMLEDVLSVEEYARSLGCETVSPYISDRLLVGVSLAEKYSGDETAFADALYRTVGAGGGASESVPAALSVAYYCMDVKHSAILCANLGGDTDTIGAIACAICGAAQGANQIPQKYIDEINRANGVDFRSYAEALTEKRGNITV